MLIFSINNHALKTGLFLRFIETLLVIPFNYCVSYCLTLHQIAGCFFADTGEQRRIERAENSNQLLPKLYVGCNRTLIEMKLIRVATDLSQIL